MELTYFYKAEMPNCQDWTLDISKLNISLIWDRIIKIHLYSGLNGSVPIIRSSNSHKSARFLPALIPSIS